MVYFEKQEASLCAQHVLNNLLQDSYFTPADLAEIARELDRSESALTGGVALRESQNVDDSGNFSSQVLEEALARFGNIRLSRDFNDYREAIAILESDGTAALDDAMMPAFVFHFDNHWYCCRFIHRSYWMLNSLAKQPEPISKTHLAALIATLKNEGGDVFVVLGDLPKPSVTSKPTINLASSDDATNVAPTSNATTTNKPGEARSMGESADAEAKSKSAVAQLKPFTGKGFVLTAGPGGVGRICTAVPASEASGANSGNKTMKMSAPPSAGSNVIDLADATTSSSTSEIPEPPATEPHVVITLVLPSTGKRTRRRFPLTSVGKEVYDYASALTGIQDIALVDTTGNETLLHDDPLEKFKPGTTFRVVS